jgi:hypothetical protein
MIGVRDVAAGVPDLLSAQRLDCVPCAVGGVQDCGDLGAAPPGERRASAGRMSSTILGRPRLAQRVSPTTSPGSSPNPVRHPWHAPALACRLGQTTRDRQAPAVRTPAHVTLAAPGDSAPRWREPRQLGIPTQCRRTRRPGPPGRRLHGLGDPHTRRNRPVPTTLGPSLDGVPAQPSTRNSRVRLLSLRHRACSPGCPASRSWNTSTAGYTSLASPHIPPQTGSATKHAI